MKRRLLSILLVCVMLVGTLAIPAMADSGTVTIATGVGNVELTWDESYFAGSTTEYVHGLAQVSMALSQAAVHSKAKDGLKTLGFSDAVDVAQQSGEYAAYTTGFAIGTKVLSDGMTVIAVVFDESNGAADSSANYDFIGYEMGKRDYDIPYCMVPFMSAQYAYETIMNKIPTTGDYCIWLTGYGRGGSVANMLGMMLDTPRFDIPDDAEYADYNGYGIGTGHVRSYSFAAPGVADAGYWGFDESASIYNNLFTINNPEDLVPYIPQWGYGLFGQVIEMRTFNGAYKADLNVQNNVASLYETYTTKDFYAYASSDVLAPVTLATKTISGDSLAPTLEKYYTTEYATNTSNKMTTYALMRQVFGSLFGTGSFDGVMSIAIDIYLNYNSPYKPIVDYALKYGLHVSSIGDALELIGQSSYTFYELLTAYEPETYLAWMMSTSSLSELSASTVRNDGEKNKADEGVNITGNNVFFDDVNVFVEKVDDFNYSLNFYSIVGYDAEDKAINYVFDPYGPVTVTVPIPSEYKDMPITVFIGGNEQVTTKNSVNGTISFVTRSSGTFTIHPIASTEEKLYFVDGDDTTDGNIAYVANNKSETDDQTLVIAYYKGSKMIKVESKVLVEKSQDIQTVHITDADADRIEIMLIGNDNVPVCESIEVSTTPAVTAE